MADRSELFSAMTVGMATVAGSVLVGHVLLGVPLDYLLAAAFMTAPSGLLMAKMVVPETEDATLTDNPRATWTGTRRTPTHLVLGPLNGRVAQARKRVRRTIHNPPPWRARIEELSDKNRGRGHLRPPRLRQPRIVHHPPRPPGPDRPHAPSSGRRA